MFEPTLDSLITPSVSLWLDNLLIKKHKGFANTTQTLQKVSGPKANWYTWASPHRQWVYDSSVSGAQIPSGVTKNAVFVPKSSTVKLDFTHGGLFLSTNTNDTISAAYSYKQVNVYITQDSLQTVLFEKKYSADPRSTSSSPDKITDFVYPCIIITPPVGNNDTLDFEGNVATKFFLRLIFMAEDSFTYQTVCGLLRDQKEVHIPIFDANELPFTEFGDLKTETFNYGAIASTIQTDPSRLIYLKEVAISPFPPTLNNKMGVTTFGAFIDIDLEILRYPR